MTFGERLKELRNKKRLTQQEVADFIGMSAPGYVKVEQGQREFNFDKLVRVSECLCVSVDYLLKGCESEVVDSFGGRLKALRGSKTQQEISEKAEVSRSSYSHYENGHVEPDLKTLVKLATVFKVTTDYLLGYEVEK